MAEPITDLITFIYTHDLVAADRFYGTILGLPLTLDQGGCHIYQAGRDAYLGVCERDNAPTGPDDPGIQHVIVTLVTDHVDVWFDKVEQAGVRVDQPPQVNERYGIYHAFVRDPSGYRVEIQQFLNPDWRGPQ